MDWFSWGRKKKDGQASAGRLYLNEDYIQQHLLAIDFNSLVTLPNSVERVEWLASHVVSFYENVAVFTAALSEFCQPSTCPQMSIPGNVLQWVDEKNKKRSCTALQYIDLVMSFIHQCLNDGTTFPTKYGHQFPGDIEATLCKMTRLLFYVIAHVYHSHFEVVLQLEFLPYLNTLTYHLMTFAKTFRLVDDRDLLPLNDLYTQLHRMVVAMPATGKSSSGIVFVNGKFSPWTEDVSQRTDDEDNNSAF